jgi:hypothetical protein
MYAVLMRRADALVDCMEGSAEDVDLTATVDAIEADELGRCPEGKIPCGKESSQR